MLDDLFSKFSNSYVLVIGDVMIDAYLSGAVSRISPEAPVPILNVFNRDYRLGGAANVALNLKKLGAKPILCSLIGDDEKSAIFSHLIAKADLDDSAIIHSKERITTIKYRVIGNNSQMLRIDEENDNYLTDNENSLFIDRISFILNNYNINAIIIEDYDKGLLSQANLNYIIACAKKKNIPIATDPKKRNFHNYNGVTLFKPNFKEFCDAMNLNPHSIALNDLKYYAETFVNHNNIDLLMITLSENGISIYNRCDKSFTILPANKLEVCDVSGAGDTVISIATLCLIAGLDPQKIASIANLAGGIVCQYQGVVPIDTDALRKELNSSPNILQ